MGSSFAGLKAGVMAGIAYFAVLSVFDVVLLFVLQADAEASILAGPNAAACPSAYDCLVAVMQISVPLFAVVGFFVSLVFAVIFGRFFESIPGRSYRLRGISMGLILLIVLVLIGLVGYDFDMAARLSSDVFELVASVGYGILLGALYRRYTRAVSFEVPGSSVRVLVDGKDLTGKTRTFAVTSNHKVRAEPDEGVSFREWAVSGGVTVEDPRSYETAMEVNGDGMLKPLTVRK